MDVGIVITGILLGCLLIRLFQELPAGEALLLVWTPFALSVAVSLAFVALTVVWELPSWLLLLTTLVVCGSALLIQVHYKRQLLMDGRIAPPAGYAVVPRGYVLIQDHNGTYNEGEVYQPIPGVREQLLEPGESTTAEVMGNSDEPYKVIVENEHGHAAARSGTFTLTAP